MITRRAFLAAGGALAGLAAPFRAGAQKKPEIHRIAWLTFDQPGGSPFLDAFREGMRDQGYVEGRNLEIDLRWGSGSMERMGQLAAELARSNAQVIVTQGGLALRPMVRANPVVPIVFTFSGDPQAAGFIDSLARPGRNVTGISFLSLDLVGKRIELLKEIMPSLKRLAVIANPEHAGEPAELRVSLAAANSLGISVDYFQARNQPQLEESLAAVLKSRAEAVVAFPDAILLRLRERIAAFSLQHRVPAISGWAQFADSGNLMSYGPNLRASHRRLSVYVDKILKGAKAAELPVELPTVVEFVVNLKTAKALGITIPQSILLRADRVIE